MDILEIEKLLSEVTYKPGYHIRVDTSRLDENMVGLIAQGTVIDVHHPETHTTVHRQIMFSEYSMSSWTKDILLESVRWIFRDLELHEVDEWLKYKGDIVTEPH